jgi:hypothetical protein
VATAAEARTARAQAVLDDLRGGRHVRVEGEDEVMLAVLGNARDEDLEELKRLWRRGRFGWPVASRVAVILDTLSAKRACEEAHAVRLPNGVLHKLSLWLWRRWLLLLGAVSGTAAAALDFINGFEIGRRIVAVLLLLIGY